MQWTEEEVEYLKAHYEEDGPAKIAAKINRSLTSVVSKGHALDLKTINRNKNSLSLAEQKKIIELSETMSGKAIARRLGRNADTVRNFMKKNSLGMYKDPVKPVLVECKPPESCFSCPAPDCIQKSLAPTSKEAEYLAIAKIKTVGHGEEPRKWV